MKSNSNLKGISSIANIMAETAINAQVAMDKLRAVIESTSSVFDENSIEKNQETLRQIIKRIALSAEEFRKLSTVVRPDIVTIGSGIPKKICDKFSNSRRPDVLIVGPELAEILKGCENMNNGVKITDGGLVAVMKCKEPDSTNSDKKPKKQICNPYARKHKKEWSN